MDTSTRSGDPIAETLREHVRSPIEVATTCLNGEYEEVEAELAAYRRFKDRVASIDTASTPRSPEPGPRRHGRQGQGQAVEAVRTAFRETVMGVEHYEGVYGESLVEHAAAELSAEAAVVFRGEPATPFTELTSRVLRSTVTRAIEQREAFLTTLAGEREFLETSGKALTDLIEDYETVPAPDSNRSEVTDRLDDLAADRQKMLRNRTAGVRTDGHDLCEYLYRNQEWTYPVLMAITRFRTAVV
jgi:hypothetical protein